MLRQRYTGSTSGVLTEELPQPHKYAKPPKKFSQKILSNLWFLIKSLFVFFYVVIPLVFYCSPWLRRSLIFMNYVNLSPSVNFSSPPIDCCHNFYLKSEPGVTIGVWHMPPKSIECKEGFVDEHPVILYLHGSGGSRGSQHRRGLYKVLTESPIDAHVITLDYRGFGDSTNKEVNVMGIVRDASAVYEWISKNVPNRKIFVWGHSMGTGVATHLLARLNGNESPQGLILEAPFTTMPEAVGSHPLSFAYRHFPLFKYFFMDPVKHEETFFNNQANLAKIQVPLMLLHAEDDELLDYKFSTILKDIAVSSYVRFHSYNSSNHYGHKYLFRDPGLPEKVNNFISDTSS